MQMVSSPPSPSLAAMSDLDYGAGFIGLVIGAILYGMTLLQANTYFHRYRDDNLWLKLSVVLLCLLDTLHICFSVYTMYFLLIVNFGDISAADQSVWSLKAFSIIQVIVIVLVQTLYVLRIWKISRAMNAKISPALLAGLAVISLTAFGVGILIAVRMAQLTEIRSRFRWDIFLAFGVTIVIDICIATILSLLLYKSRTGINKRTDSMLFAIIQYIVGTGTLTSIGCVIYLVLYVSKPDTLLFFAQNFLMTRLYVNSYLAMTNAREGLRHRLSEPTVSQIDISHAMRFKTVAPSLSAGLTSTMSESTPEPLRSELNDLPLRHSMTTGQRAMLE